MLPDATTPAHCGPWACALWYWVRLLNAVLQPVLFATALTLSLSLMTAVTALNLAGLRAHQRRRARSRRVRDWRAGLGRPPDASPDEPSDEDGENAETEEAEQAKAVEPREVCDGPEIGVRALRGPAAHACIRRATARMLGALHRAEYVLDPQHFHTIVVQHPAPLEEDPAARALQLDSVCKVAAQLARDAEDDRKGAGGRPRDPDDVFGGLEEGRTVVAVCVVRWDGGPFLCTGLITGALYRGAHERAPGVLVCLQADALPEESLSGALFTS